jgi:hypothetical protein
MAVIQKMKEISSVLPLFLKGRIESPLMKL